MDVGDLIARLKIDKKDLDKAEKAVDKLSGKLTSIGKVSAFASLAAGAIGLTAASKGAAGALVAIPAAGAMAMASFAALKVGTQGVGDALSALADGDAAKAAEALAKLSPNAKAAVLAMDGVRKSFAGVKKLTQDSLFKGLDKEVVALGRTYLPILRFGLGANASALNAWAKSASTAARSPFVTGAVASILEQTATSMAGNAPIAGSLVTIFAALARAGMPLMTSALGAASGFLQAKAAFLSSAQGAQWLSAKVSLARSILGALWAVVKNVGSLLGSVFNAANSQGSLLLGTLVRLTGAAAAWAKSAEGQKQLGDLFNLLGQVLQNLLIILPPITGAIMSLASFVASLPGPVQSVVTGFLSFALVAGLLLPKIMGLVSTLFTLGRGAITAGSWIATMAPRLWASVSAAGAAAGAHAMAAGRIVLAWGRMALAATVSALRTAGAWLLSTGASAATAVATTVASLARMALAWAVAAAGAMARAVVMAAAWFVALGPIGWVIAAVIGLVALIIANWDRVKGWTLAAWNAVVGFVTGAWARVKAAVIAGIMAAVAFIITGWARARAMTASALSALVGAVSSGISRVVGFVRSLPGKILAALSRLGSLLVGLGRDMVRGLWNGISAGWSWLTGMVKGLATRLLNAAKSALGIGSPSKLFEREVGRWLPAGVDVGVQANTKRAVAAVQSMGRQLVTKAQAAVTGGPTSRAVRRADPGFDYRAAAAATADAFADVLTTSGMTASFDPRGILTMQRTADVRDRQRGLGLLAPGR